jgi:hypothetical protein
MQFINSRYQLYYCRCLVTLAWVEGTNQLSRSGGGGTVLAAYVSVGTTSLECSGVVVTCFCRQPLQ